MNSRPSLHVTQTSDNRFSFTPNTARLLSKLRKTAGERLSLGEVGHGKSTKNQWHPSAFSRKQITLCNLMLAIFVIVVCMWIISG